MDIFSGKISYIEIDEMPIYELDLLITSTEKLLKEREAQSRKMQQEAEQARVRESLLNPQVKKFK